MKIPLVLVAVVLLLAGCSTTAPKAVESTPPPPAKPQATYSTVVELRDAFVKAGGDCPDWVANNRVKLAAQSGDCDANTVLSTYLSADIRDQVVTTLKGLSVDTHLLVGENWVINVADPDLFVKVLGGTVVTG